MAYPFYRMGFWIRETGIALDKVGCFLQGNSAYAEEGHLRLPDQTAITHAHMKEDDHISSAW
jgi:hypothetical protein